MRHKFVHIACAALLALPFAFWQTPAQAAQKNQWNSETLSGTIMMVDQARHLVVIKGEGGVPFDMVLTPTSRIRSANGRLTARNLSSDVNKSVSVRFLPEGRGDIVQSMNVSG